MSGFPVLQSGYPPDHPMVLGAPDGVVRPARMIATAHGVRVGTDVWVTGDGVDAAVGVFIQLLEGEVGFIDDEPSERVAGVTAEPKAEPVAPADVVVLPDPAPPEPQTETLGPPAPPEVPSQPVKLVEPAAVEDVAEMSYDELRTEANRRGLHFEGRGRPSKQRLIQALTPEPG